MKRVAARIALFLLLFSFILTSAPAFSADRIQEWEGNLSAQKEEFIKLVDDPGRMDRTLATGFQRACAAGRFQEKRLWLVFSWAIPRDGFILSDSTSR